MESLTSNCSSHFRAHVTPQRGTRHLGESNRPVAILLWKAHSDSYPHIHVESLTSNNSSHFRAHCLPQREDMSLASGLTFIVRMILPPRAHSDSYLHIHAESLTSKGGSHFHAHCPPQREDTSSPQVIFKY